MEYPFGRKLNGDSNTSGYSDQGFNKEIISNPGKRATRASIHIQSVWVDLKYVLKDYFTETVGDIVIVRIRK